MLAHRVLCQALSHVPRHQHTSISGQVHKTKTVWKSSWFLLACICSWRKPFTCKSLTSDMRLIHTLILHTNSFHFVNRAFSWWQPQNWHTVKKNETKYSEAEKAASGWFRSQHVLFRDDSGSICCELIILRTRDHLRSQIKPLLVATCYRKIARKNECYSRCSFWINMRATCPSPLTHTPPHAVWRLSYWWNALCPPLLA